MRDCEVLVSVACVRKLVALAFITQSERIQASRSLEPAAPTSGGHTEGPEGLGDFGSVRVRSGTAKPIRHRTRRTRLAIGLDRFG